MSPITLYLCGACLLVLLFCCYVDDIVAIGNNHDDITRMNLHLSSRVHARDIGLL